MAHSRFTAATSNSTGSTDGSIEHACMARVVNAYADISWVSSNTVGPQHTLCTTPVHQPLLVPLPVDFFYMCSVIQYTYATANTHFWNAGTVGRQVSTYSGSTELYQLLYWYKTPMSQKWVTKEVRWVWGQATQRWKGRAITFPTLVCLSPNSPYFLQCQI